MVNICRRECIGMKYNPVIMSLSGEDQSPETCVSKSCSMAESPGTTANEIQETQPAGTIETQPLKPYPGFGQAVLLLLSFVFLQALASIPLAIAGLIGHPAAVAIPTLLATAVVAYYGLQKTGISFGEVFPFGAVSISVFLSLLLTVGDSFVLLREVAGLVSSVIPPPRQFYRSVPYMLRTRPHLWETFLFAAIVAPLSEEILFRGLILYGFLKRYGVRTAIIASALLFTLIHGNPWQFATGAFFGTLLAWCFVRTRSLVPCIFAHMANNALGCTMILIQMKFPAFRAVIARGSAFQHLTLVAAGLVLAISGIYLLRRAFNSSRSPVQAFLIGQSFAQSGKK